jgi:glycosyltransferase involved in cell wall biosynthesis
MKLSIIIPVYNTEKYLGKCIESVISLSLFEKEIIIVDDESTDSSFSIAKNYEEKYENIKLFHKKNEGVSKARNFGISKASGEYILFLDADDYLRSDAGVLLEEAIKSDIDFTAFAYTSLYVDEKEKLEKYSFFEEKTMDKTNVLENALISSEFNTCWAKLFKRKIIVDNGLEFREDMKIGEDAVFVLSYLMNSESVSVLNNSLINYRIHPESMMKKSNFYLKIKDLGVLYTQRMEILRILDNKILEKRVNRHFFSVITNLMLSMAEQNEKKDLKKEYREFFKLELVEKIIKKTEFGGLKPVFKKFEYILIRIRNYSLMAWYFKFKNKF